MKKIAIGIAAVCLGTAGNGQTVGRRIDGLAGGIWADANNDGYVDGYVYRGQYYAGRPKSAVDTNSQSSNSGSRPYLGVGLQPLESDTAASLRLPAGTGEVVRAVAAGSPADRVGLRVGDVITQVGSTKIDTNHPVSGAVAAGSVGVPLKILVLRNRAYIALEAIPTERPASVDEQDAIPDPGIDAAPASPSLPL